MRLFLCIATFILAFFGLFGCHRHLHVQELHLQEGIKRFQIHDYREAFFILKPLAQAGQIDAQYAVGYMYYYGQGVVENRQRAWYWINKSAAAGQPEAQAALAILKRQPEAIMP